MNTIARQLLRFVVQALAFESVARAALRSSPLHTMADELIILVNSIVDAEADINCAMEGLIFTLIALLDNWSTTPGVLLDGSYAGPASIVQRVPMEVEVTMRYHELAVPAAASAVRAAGSMQAAST
jgi:hypothetical protein